MILWILGFFWWIDVEAKKKHVAESCGMTPPWMSISQVDEEIKRRKMDPDFSSVYINHRSFKAINTIQRGFKVGEMSVIARGVIFSGFCQNLVIFYSKSYTCQKKGHFRRFLGQKSHFRPLLGIFVTLLQNHTVACASKKKTKYIK